MAVVIRIAVRLQQLIELRPAKVRAGKLHHHQPSAYHVCYVMELIGVGHAVQGCVDCEREEKDVSDMSEPEIRSV